MMSVLERIVRSGYHLGAPGASADGSRLYTARGWRLWRGPTSALTPDGIRRTAEADGGGGVAGGSYADRRSRDRRPDGTQAFVVSQS